MSNLIYKPPPALNRLVSYFMGKSKSPGHACIKISEKMNRKWSGKYIYQIWVGKYPATAQFKQYIHRLDQKTFQEKRHWLNIHALTEDQKERWKMVPMAERRKALDKAYQLLEEGRA